MGFVNNYDEAEALGNPDNTGRFQKGTLETSEGDYEVLLEREVRDGIAKRVIRDNDEVLYAEVKEMEDGVSGDYSRKDFYKNPDMEGELAQYGEDSFDDLWNDAKGAQEFQSKELENLI